MSTVAIVLCVTAIVLFLSVFVWMGLTSVPVHNFFFNVRAAFRQRRRNRYAPTVYMEQVGENEFRQVEAVPSDVYRVMSGVPIARAVFYRTDSEGKAYVATSPRSLGHFFGPYRGRPSADTSVEAGHGSRPDWSR